MLVSVLFVVGGCSDGGSEKSEPGAGGTLTGGAPATGGYATGGVGLTATGGVGATATGGMGMGGSPTGGVTPTGGMPSGGMPPAGGTLTGGVPPAGGTPSGGAATGGVGAGGAVTGGVGAGGAVTGGVGAGGSATGGEGAVGTGGGGNPTDVTVQLTDTHQPIQGFGINATIMPGGESLPWQQLFGLDGPDALGLSILRIGMNENGGHRDVPSDWETARSLGAKIIGSCWTAPADWKDNGSTTGGGHLSANRYSDWATRIADYASQNNLYAMSIGNETDFASCSPSQGRPCNPPLTDEYESMVYTGKELAAFVKVAGPIFDQRAPNTRMIAPEASLWIHVWSNLSPTNKANGGYDSSDPLGCGCFSNEITEAAEAACPQKCKDGDGYNYGHWLAADTDAWNAFDILGVHEYESQVGYKWPADVTGGVRDKEVWQTEMSGVMYWPEQGPSTNIDNGVAVAGWIHSALTVGEASAWLYWWYKAYYQDDNEGLAYTKNGQGPAKRYYAMGNYSRFVRPGYTAVGITGEIPANVLLSAYSGDGHVVVVAINKGSAAAEVPITIAGGTAPTSMTPWVTSASDDLASKTAVSVTGGVFTASLPAKSVTSFVSD